MYLTLWRFRFSSESRLCFPLRCLPSSHPQPSSALQTISQHTIYDLKSKSEERMMKSLAGGQASEDMNCLLSLIYEALESTWPKLQLGREKVFREGNNNSDRVCSRVFHTERAKAKIKSRCKTTRRGVVQCFFFKRRKNSFPKRHKALFL